MKEDGGENIAWSPYKKLYRETWNDSNKQETHAYVAIRTVNDSDRDGTAESDEWAVVDNRS